MKAHWVNARLQEPREQDEIYWVTACGLRFSDEEVEAGRASPDVSDATCGHCRRCAAAVVDNRLTEFVEIEF